MSPDPAMPLGPALLTAGTALAIGLVFGLGYFAALRANVGLYLCGGGLMPLALHVLRLAGAVIAAVIAVRLGGAPGLLGGLGGFLVARLIAVRPARRPEP